MKRITIALLSSVFIFPGAVALAQDDRGVTKADPTYSDDTIEANVDGQDVIETPEGERRAMPDGETGAAMDEPVVVEEGMDTGPGRDQGGPDLLRRHRRGQRRRPGRERDARRVSPPRPDDGDGKGWSRGDHPFFVPAPACADPALRPRRRGATTNGCLRWAVAIECHR